LRLPLLPHFRGRRAARPPLPPGGSIAAADRFRIQPNAVVVPRPSECVKRARSAFLRG
jgi:hypothetical protein